MTLLCPLVPFPLTHKHPYSILLLSVQKRMPAIFLRQIKTGLFIVNEWSKAQSITGMCPMVSKKVSMTDDLRRTFTDKNGNKFIIRPADENDYDLTLRMYDLFEPKESAQGLPPADPDRRKHWIQNVLGESRNVISATGPMVVGHACLIDIQPGVRSELVIAVHQDWQGRGLGSEMTSLLVEIARCYGYHKIWLTVEATNLKAIHVYKKFGFAFMGPFDSEREMELELK